MIRLLISGSREASPALLAFAERIVMATVSLDKDYPSCFEAQIIVGDASGVDDAVVRTAQTLGLTFVCYGVTPKPRNACQLRSYVNNEPDKTPVAQWEFREAFLRRDRRMAAECDLCVAIWNGRSTGTTYTYNEVKKLGKRARLVKL